MKALLQELIAEVKGLKDGQAQLFAGQKQLFEGQDRLFEGQKQLFEGQDRLFEGQKQLFEGQDRLFEGQKQLFEGHKQLVIGQKQLFDGQKQLFDGQKSILSRLDRVEGQLEENTAILRALEHRSQVQSAETEGLKLATASKKALARIEANMATKDDVHAISEQQAEHSKLLDGLSRRSIIHETEIHELKLVK